LPSLAVSASIIAISAVQPAVAQQAAQPAAAAGGGLEEIVVTARRKEEKAQTVPIAMTNFTAKALAEQDIRSVVDLTRNVPGLNVSIAGGSYVNGSYTWLRGVSGLIAYFDEIPTSLNNPSLFFDVGNVQVLKGPQGTLFGLSNDAGAIVYQPNHPTNSFEGYAKVTLGDYGRHTFDGVVNVPIVEDKVMVRVGGQIHDQDGYLKVQNRNYDEYDQHYRLGRLSVLLRPTDDFQNETMVNYLDTYDHGGAYVLQAVNPAAPQAFPIPVDTLIGILKATGAVPKNAQTLTQLLAEQKRLGKYTLVGTDGRNNEFRHQWDIVNTTTWDIADNLTLRNIAGYEEVTNLNFNNANLDIDGVPLPLLNGPTPLQSQEPGPSTQYTEELQLQGKLLNDRLSFTVGTFNQWGGFGSLANTTAPYLPYYRNSFGTVTGTSGTAVSRSNAVYGQATYDFSDWVPGLSFTGGYRFTYDKFYVSTRAYSAQGVFLPGSATTQKANYSSPSYTLSLQYQFDPKTMVYVTDSKGYKTGGFNSTGIIGPLQLYGPEHLNNVETGIKTDFDIGDMKARVNFSGFYGFYDDIQVQVTGVYPQVTPGVFSLGTPYLNVGDGAIYGYDGEFTLKPTDDLEVGVNFGYNRGNYESFLGPNPAYPQHPGTVPLLIPLGGIEYAYTPLWKYNIHASYQLPLDASIGEVSITGTYNWTGDRVNGAISPLTQYNIDPAYDDLDISIDWHNIMGHDGLDGQFFMTNVTDNDIAPGSLAAYQVIGIYGAAIAQPRMFGFSLKYAFGGATEEPAPAAPYTPPPVAAPAPSVAKSYMVFFDFNKSDLTSQAEQIVDQAAANAGPAKVTRLTVTGHTDTVGSDAYNMRLSRRRAESVAARLEKDGIPSSEIEIVAKGKRDLLVPTADGVREPQNRRVQIVYDGGPNS
jgi:iron complex outermembrane receptor protein